MNVDDPNQNPTEAADSNPSKRFRVGIIPFLLLTVGFAAGVGLLIFGMRPATPAPAPTAVGAEGSPAATAGSTGAEATDIPGDGFGIVPGPATPWAVAGGPGEVMPTLEPSAAPAATDAPVATIDLLGPPPDSLFRSSDLVSFYWTSSDEVTPVGRFIVYILDGEERIALGEVSGPNLGDAFTVQAGVGQVVGGAGEYDWLVVVEDPISGEVIGASETRRLVLIADN